MKKSLNQATFPKQIVFFSTDSKPKTGGIAEYLHQICEQLGRAFPLEFYSTVPGVWPCPPKAYRAYTLQSRPLRHLGRKFGDALSPIRKFNTYRYYKSLERLAAYEVKKADNGRRIFVVVGAWSPESHFWCLACRRFQIPYAIVFYGLDLIYELDGRTNLWRQQDLLGALHLIVISSPTERLVKKVAGRDVLLTVLHPTVGSDGYRQPDESMLSDLKTKLRIPDGALTLLGVGRLIKRKGFDLVLDSLAYLKKDYGNLFFILVGDGPERQNLMDKARALGVSDKFIHLTGVDDQKKSVLYSLCDIFVMPNRTLGGRDWEGFGIVFLEAALAGKPVVGGNNGGVTDAVVHQETGLLVETDNHQQVTQAIQRLLLDPGLRSKMGDNARQRTRQFFSGSRTISLFSQRILRDIKQHG